MAYYDHAFGTVNAGTQHTPILEQSLPYGTNTLGSSGGSPFTTVYNNTFSNLFSQGSVTPQDFPRGYFLLRDDNQYTSALKTRKLEITVPQGVYDPNGIAELITSKINKLIDQTAGGSLGERGLLVNPSDSSIGSYALVNIDVSDPRFKSYKVRNTGSYGVAPYKSGVIGRYLGASTFSLEFVDDYFAFTNLHSPVFNVANGIKHAGEFLEPGIAVQVTGQGRFDTITDVGGCLITALEPAAFWNKLGFTGSQIASEIVFDDAVFQALGSAPEKRAYFDAHRVTGVNSSAGLRSTETPFLAFRPSQVSGEADSTYTYPLQGTDTTAVTATESYTVDSNGYYRIECVSSFQTEYQQEGARLGSTIAAVSTNYNSNDFITAYSESGFAYEHVGTTQMLSGMTIRLIDPSTDLPVLGMGPNSTVFLEVVKSSGNTEGVGGRNKGKKSKN